MEVWLYGEDVWGVGKLEAKLACSAQLQLSVLRTGGRVGEIVLRQMAQVQ